MTTDEIYEIAQKAKGECVTLGWFEGNIPCKDMWREELCYYVDHTVDEVEVFWYRKEDGRIIHNIKIVKNGDFDEIHSKKINLSWIRKVNGESVDMKYMDFKNDWSYCMLKLSDYIEYWRGVCEGNNYRFSSYFCRYWKDIVVKMIEVRDIKLVRKMLCENCYERYGSRGGTYFDQIHWKTWDKLLIDLETIFNTALKRNKTWLTEYGRDKTVEVQLFQFLHNLFLTEDVKNVTISLS